MGDMHLSCTLPMEPSANLPMQTRATAMAAWLGLLRSEIAYGPGLAAWVAYEASRRPRL